MKRIIGILALVMLINVSCKNKSKSITSEIKDETLTLKHLTISFNFKTNKQDIFKIMLNNIKIDELQNKNIHIFEDVTPSTGFDAIIAKFDADNISNNIIFSLGNKEVKEVEIKSILVSYGNNQVNITSPKDLNKYIRFNKFIKKDSLSNILHTQKINGKLNPTFSFKRRLINQLKKE